jgi:hypothetical protein
MFESIRVSMPQDPGLLSQIHPSKAVAARFRSAECIELDFLTREEDRFTVRASLGIEDWLPELRLEVNGVSVYKGLIEYRRKPCISKTWWEAARTRPGQIQNKKRVEVMQEQQKHAFEQILEVK